MKNKLCAWLVLFSLLITANISLAQSTNTFRRNDDAATATGQADNTPLQAGTNKYRESYVNWKPGTTVCNAAAETGTAAKVIIPAVAATSHYVSRVWCHNNTTVASIITLGGIVGSDIIGTTTLGTNRITFEFPNPAKAAANTAVTFTMTTTATSTICCANYKDYPNPW